MRVFVFYAFLMVAAACSKEESVPVHTLVGSWKLVSTCEAVNVCQFPTAASHPFITITKDNSYTITTADTISFISKIALTQTDSKSGHFTILGNESFCSYRISGNQLIIDSGDFILATSTYTWK